MALKPSSYVILGLVHGGVTSGYSIKRFIEQQRMELFWATTFAQVYPELAHLEERGYLTHCEDPHGARQRRAYSLTDKGEEALIAWLGRPRFPQRELRDEGLLRLAFADNLPPEEAVALVRRLRERAEESEREFREEVIPRGEALMARGLRFPVEIGRLARAHQQATIEFLTQLEAELTEQLAAITATGARKYGSSADVRPVRGP